MPSADSAPSRPCPLCGGPAAYAGVTEEDGHRFILYVCSSAGTGLAPRGRAPCVGTRIFVPTPAPSVPVVEGEFERPADLSDLAGWTLPLRLRTGLRSRPVDRKSTRLNSSH